MRDQGCHANDHQHTGQDERRFPIPGESKKLHKKNTRTQKAERRVCALSVSLKRAVVRPPEMYFESYRALHAWIASPMEVPVPGPPPPKEAALVGGLYLLCAYYDGASLVDTRMSMRPKYALALEVSSELESLCPPIAHPEIDKLSP